jgi:hypothetical protein
VALAISSGFFFGDLRAQEPSGGEATPLAGPYHRAAEQLAGARQSLEPRDDDSAHRRRMRQALLESRASLIGEGVPEALAQALTDDTELDGSDPRSAAATLARVQRRLHSFGLAVERSRGGYGGVADGAEQELREVLADPIFASSLPRATLRERAWHHLQRWFERLAPWLARAAEGTGPWLGTIVVLLILLVVAASLRLLWARRASLRSRRQTTLSASVEQAEFVMTRASAALAHADAQLNAGRPLVALRWLQLAVVLALREQGHLPPERGLTDLESARSVENHAPPGIARDFAHIVDLHDRVVFAGRPLMSDALDEARGLAGTIVGPSVAEAR